MRVGFVGWRGMVGSVLMQRMLEERDFDTIEPVFFSTSSAGGKSPSIGRVSGPLRDANSPTAFEGLDAIEVGTDERVGGEPPGLELGVDVLDGRLDDLERLRLGLRDRHAQADGRPGDGTEGDDGDARPPANPHLTGH